MAATDFASFALRPTGSSDVSHLQFTVKFNCDSVGAVRSNYNELSNDLRFSVNGTVVYTVTGSVYWQLGTGSGVASRKTYPGQPTTPKHSPAIWYVLSAADVISTGIESGTAFDVTVEIKGNADHSWTAVKTNSVTLNVYADWHFQFVAYDIDFNELASWWDTDTPPEGVSSSALTYITWTAYSLDTEFPYTVGEASYVELGLSKTSPATTVYSLSAATAASVFYEITEPLEAGTWYVRASWTEDVSGTVRDVETTMGVVGALSKPINPTPANNATAVDFSGLTLSWDNGGGANWYDVYIGKSGDLTLVSEGQVDTFYTTSMLELAGIFEASPINQKIYWQVNAFSDESTEVDGDEWNFDPRPGKVTSPSPAVSATGLRLFPPYAWTAGTGATSYTLHVTV
jgi:hypothetical protein